MKKTLHLKPSQTVFEQKNCSAVPWRILIVDDEEDVHSITRLILAKISFKQRPVQLLSAYSAAEAETLLQTEADIAVILLDVVMETEDAGLRLVHIIRDQLNNKAVRIILRTGQAGQAPEEAVIVDYDINDYKTKSELTSQKLFTTVIASLRAYESIISLKKTRAGLEKILQSSDALFQIPSLCEFATGVLTQVSLFLDCHPSGMIYVHENQELNTDTLCLSDLKVLAASGEYSDCLNCSLDDRYCHQDIREHVLQAFKERKNQFAAHYTVLYLETGVQKAALVLVSCGLYMDENDRNLLSVFAAKISIALANAFHIAELKKAKLEAEQANLAKRDFLSCMSHELRTPMNAVLGFAQLLELEDLTADQQDSVQQILTAGHHLLALINQVLDLAKIESGHLKLNLAKIDLPALVQNCKVLVQPLADKNAIKITDHISAATNLLVTADSLHLKQVLLNLISNAIKYNRRGGSVIFSCELGLAQSLRINVTDTGNGLSEAQLGKLFQAFERDTAKHSNIEGSGIGLCISKQLIEAMNGRIGVSSRVGVGSCFWIEVPLA